MKRNLSQNEQEDSDSKRIHIDEALQMLKSLSCEEIAMEAKVKSQANTEEKYLNESQREQKKTNEVQSTVHNKDQEHELLVEIKQARKGYTNEYERSLKEYSSCWSCNQPFNKETRKQLQDVCGHTCCSECVQAERHRPCKHCASIFETDNRIFSDGDSVTKWLFDDIQNNCKDFLKESSDGKGFKKYAHTDQILACLREKFKLHSFRRIQYAAINAVMLGENVFVLMPSGGGKSLIYQLPAVCSNEVTVVISPLISLIHDQVNTLKNLGISAAHLIGSPSDNAKVMSMLSYKVPLLRLLYLTPEKFKHENVKKILITLNQNKVLKRIVFDEAHCVTLWGKDFRYAYTTLKSILNRVFSNVPVLLLTASATPDERIDIIQTLGLHSSRNLKYFLYSFNRPNLQYEVECINMQKRAEKVLEICLNEQFINSTGIIYCISKDECNVMSDFLCKNDVSAKPYHASLTDSLRLTIQNEWASNSPNCRVIVATIAFGMGINKPDVKFVIHCGLPKSLEGYYQESGRAGRNNQYALCKLFWTPQDVKIWTETLRASRKSKINKPDYASANETVLKKQLNALSKMEEYALQTAECRRKFMLRYFGQDYDSFHCLNNISSVCDNCLKNLD